MPDPTTAELSTRLDNQMKYLDDLQEKVDSLEANMTHIAGALVALVEGVKASPAQATSENPSRVILAK